MEISQSPEREPHPRATPRESGELRRLLREATSLVESADMEGASATLGKAIELAASPGYGDLSE